MSNINLFFVLTFLLTYILPAQNVDYGNSWYIANSGRPFVKFEVTEDGIYRVQKEDLLEAGYDLNLVDPQTFQLYYRGEEVPVFIGSSGSVWEYIEFFGKRNDGLVDTILYRDAYTRRQRSDMLPDKDINFFSDISAYFLTWGNMPGKRYNSYLNTRYNRFSPEAFYWYKAKFESHPNVGNVRFQTGGAGNNDATFTLNSDFVLGEGYFYHPVFNPSKFRSVTLDTPVPYRDGPSAILRTRVTGVSSGRHDLQVKMNGYNAPLIDSAGISDRYIHTFEGLIDTILGDAITLVFQASDASDNNNNRISWASVTYAREWNLLGKAYTRVEQWEKQEPAYINIQQVRGRDSIVVYDPASQLRSAGVLIPSDTLNEARIIVGPGTGRRTLIVASDSAIRKPVISDARLSYLHNPAQGAEFVIIAHPSLKNSAEAYAQYRDTAQINPLSAKVVYTDQIYDEYGYGSVTPWAIKRFCKDALDNWELKPRYFLLWGKGNNITRKPSSTMVPTYGYPATDYEYVGHFDPNSSAINPEAAIGRINLYNDQEGFNYLEKVREYEHASWEPWMKKAVFLGGGSSLSEQQRIEGSHNRNIAQLVDSPYGSDITYFQKRASAEDFDPTDAPYHTDIDQGVFLLHFLGHSQANILDVNLRSAFEYNNEGRYPFMIAMGCYGGNFTGGRSFGEGWIVQQRKGAIGYLANSSVGSIFPLDLYAGNLYQHWLPENAGNSIGEIIQEGLDQFIGRYRDPGSYNTGRQMNLQGDPAIKLYYPELPDYEIADADIFFYPEVFTTKDDSFQINIILDNQARAISDSVNIRVTQILPDGIAITQKVIRHPSPALTDTISEWLYNTARDAAIGSNTFRVEVDYSNDISEFVEDNNTAGVSQDIPGNIAQPLFPSMLSVEGEQPLKLIASAFFTDLNDSIRYQFEIDTTNGFDSPLLKNSGIINGSVYNGSWEIPFELQDSTAYHWRVKLVDADPAIWQESTFTYLKGESGWGQAHTSQFKRAILKDLALDTYQNLWKFQTRPAEVTFEARKGNTFQMFVNSGKVADFPDRFGQNAVVFAVFDQETFEPKTDTLVFGFGGGVQAAIVPRELHKLKLAIQNAEEGDYVMVANNRNPQVPLWDEATFQVLEQIGVSRRIRLLENGDPFLILGRKGAALADVELYEPNIGNSLEITRLVYRPKNQGLVQSPLIGPALEWEKLFFQWKSLDNISSDSMICQVYGIQPEVKDTLLMTLDQQGTYDLSSINAKAYPYLKLKARFKDAQRYTPPQLSQWYVLHNPIPDILPDPETKFEFESDTIPYGASVSVNLAVRNLTATDMDSVRVGVQLQRADRTVTELEDLWIPLVKGRDTAIISYRFSSLEHAMPGEALLTVELNPQREQQEQYYFNNVFEKSFFISRDLLNPIIDATVDGVRIKDGDIVAPRPEILIQIDDENEFLANVDTANFELYFGEADLSFNLERIFISDPRLEWIPADLPGNQAYLKFYPGKLFALEDKTYMLRIQARDQSGNIAGKKLYEITFNVVNDRSATPVVNFPNPFSTATRFSYTLTGEESPVIFRLNVFNTLGQKVKVIDFVELGEARSGNHVTRYAWNGTDDQGNPLPSGLYLYEIEIAFPGGYDYRAGNYEKYFQKGWGKMYISR